VRSAIITAHEEIRRRRRLTQAELARRAGYSRAYVSRVELGDAEPSARYRAAIARVLEVPEELIFTPERREPDLGRAQSSRVENVDGKPTAA
jgi:transcriptional regulator with XRE-family HTH domain